MNYKQLCEPASSEAAKNFVCKNIRPEYFAQTQPELERKGNVDRLYRRHAVRDIQEVNICP
jgi:hypothetical protein